MARGDDNAVGDKVYAVGNPLGLEGTFSEGIVSVLRRAKGSTFIQITAPISPGSSGGPILNSRGEVVGVATATFSRGQNLNFAIPAAYVAKALSNQQRVTSLATIRPDKTIGKAGPAVGGRVLEGVQLTNFKKHALSINFSIRNNLRRPIKFVNVIFVFFDEGGNPIHSQEENFYNTIKPKLAKRVSISPPLGTLDISIPFSVWENPEKWFIEARVLDYQFAK